MPKWPHFTHLMGETLREIGILTLVLAPLDAIFGGVQIDSHYLVTAMVIGAILIAAGMLLELQT